MAEFITKKCKVHGECLHRKENKRSHYACVKCKIDRKRERRKNYKLKYIEYLGGKCKSCGYNKCAAALEFHHRDPSQKDISVAFLRDHSWEKAKKELEKCVLLCANCHREEHERIREESDTRHR